MNDHPTQPPLGAKPSATTEPSAFMHPFTPVTHQRLKEVIGEDGWPLFTDHFNHLQAELFTARAALAQCEERAAEMTARATSLVLHLPPETLAGDVQRWRDEAKAQLAAHAKALEDGRRLRDAGANLIKVWFGAAVDLNNRANRLIETNDIIARQHANQARVKAGIYDQCAVMLRRDMEDAARAASATATGGKGGAV